MKAGDMTPLEQKEIKGVTGRLMTAIIIGTISICSSVVGGVFSIKSEIHSLSDKTELHGEAIKEIKADAKGRDLQIRALQIQISTLEMRFNDYAAGRASKTN
ncbi:hypothetical protein [Arachidicoccus terrestris]|uniref:hypothetical protein n=1 Tax=Arachidicoccus terrestris TaxID=2875539 RepID=UPI001CC51F1B|nr:hypothetical protein [Arachidicoccus terrestris]UAY56276.1 hypothetical protein K9M52_04460 [Arachidicoccus terrestris]